jgi:predicted transcriptional regulator
MLYNLNHSFPGKNFWKLNMIDFIAKLEPISKNLNLSVVLKILDSIDGDNEFSVPKTKIAAQAGVCYKTVQTTFALMCKADIIRKKEKGTYMLNPHILVNGPSITYRRLLWIYDALSGQTDNSPN